MSNTLRVMWPQETEGHQEVTELEAGGLESVERGTTWVPSMSRSSWLSRGTGQAKEARQGHEEPLGWPGGN